MNENMNNISMENDDTTVEIPVASEAFEARADAAYESPVANFAGKAKGLPKSVLAIGAAVLALIVVLVLIISGAGSSSSVDLGISTSGPLGLVTTGLENSLTAINDNPVVALTDGVLNGGSMEVSVDVGTIMDSLSAGVSLDGTASVKVYSDLEKKEGALEADVEVEGMKVDAGAYVSEKAIAIASEALLGKDAYGINLKNLVKNFEDSEFGSDGDLSLGIELSEDNMISEKQLNKIEKGTKSLVKDAAKQALKSVKANAEISKENETLTFADKTTKVTAVTVEMDAEQIGAFATEMIQYVAEDKDVRKYLETTLEIVAEASDADSDDVEEAIENIYDSIEDAEDQVDDLVEQLEEMDVSFKAVFYITKSGKQLVGLDVIVQNDDEESKVSVIAGPDWAELNEISVVTESYGNEQCVSYVVEKDDKKEYSAKMTVTMNDEDVAEGNIQWDKKAGDFKVELGEEVSLNGTMKKSGKKVEILLQEICIGTDGEEYELNVTIILSTSDSTPSVPKYKDVLTMNSDELGDIGDDIQDAVENLPGFEDVQETIVGMIFGGYAYDFYDSYESYDSYEEEYYDMPAVEEEAYWG